jgi:hypothetical protein
MRAVKRHLALHDAMPRLDPLPPLWNRIAERIDAEPRTSLAPSLVPSPLRRFWMPAAAAALIAAAFLWPRGAAPEAPEVVFGAALERTTDDAFTAGGLTRFRYGDGVVVTVDADATFRLPTRQRLALRAGRVFLEVEPARRGFAVETGGVSVETTGTSFAVTQGAGGPTVEVEHGTVRCRAANATLDVRAGERWSPAAGVEPIPGGTRAVRGWFTQPSLRAKLLTPDTIRVVIRNEMPDSIELAPPVAGGPLFLASYGAHTLPLAPSNTDHPLRSGATRLAPGAELTADLRLPEPVPDDATLVIAHPASGTRAEVAR